MIANEYIGKVFGNLSVKEVYHHPNYSGTWFILDCVCGKEVKASLAKLKAKHVKSCGCIRRKHQQIFISEIDGEKIFIAVGKLQYARIIDTKELLHVCEAKKLFSLKGKNWHNKLVVHHIDGDKFNNRLDNLAVIESSGEHHKHHALMEKAMYSFLKNNDLLNDFYIKYPSLRLSTLADLV